ncbi:protein MMS22-like isoform X2 [Dreissena polymorpha]|uniref:protein MMS22-like isoform X2 n=1 Tax=Dreissena polymorpha TaxID=45954 RepID=UPI00226464E7|nr:protein MMS22-like isoform X2 [Dreissena polymorpha]
MMNHDSESLTPPLSPTFLDLEEIAMSPPKNVLPIEEHQDTIMFCCQGEVRHKGESYHSNSYWNSGFLARLIHQTTHTVTSDDPVTLLGYQWSAKSAFSQHMDRLFLILRQKIGYLQMESLKSRLSFHQEQALDSEDVRRQICECLEKVLHDIQRSPPTEEYLRQLSRNLQSLLLHVGRILDLPSHIIQSAISMKASLAHHCLHAHLDVYWRLLAILHAVTSSKTDALARDRWCTSVDSDLDLGIYEQMVQVILWDLVSMANSRFVCNVPAGGSYVGTSMFTCTCVRELWSMILKLTQWRAHTHSRDSFWMCMHHVMSDVLDADSHQTPMDLDDCRVMFNPAEGFKVTDPVGLSLWMMYNISPLFMETAMDGPLYPGDGKAVSCYHHVQTVLKKCLTMPGLTETVLRNHLKAVLLITSQWEPNTPILILLWDYFYKTLNNCESYQTSSGRLDGLACVDSTVVGLYERCKQWTLGHADSLEKDTSYQLFLRLLSEHLGRLYASGATQEWKQVKGRIYSKFHVRRVQELLEVGLYNLTALFITLGMTADLEDVASKLVDFYDMLDISSLTFARRSVVWKGVLALTLVYVNKGLDVTFLAEKMAVSFEAAVSQFVEASFDTRHHLWRLILLYMEGMQEVIDSSSNLALSQYKLLCPSIKTLLSKCSDHELRTCLSILHSIVQKYRQVKGDLKDLDVCVATTLQLADFSSALWKVVYSFVYEHAQTLTPPTTIGDMAASFCLLSLVSLPDALTSTVSVFQYFCASDKVTISVTCRFLSHLLANTALMEHVECNLENCSGFLVSVWFRCCILTPPCSELNEITRSVMNLPEVHLLLPQVGDLEEAPIRFLKAIEEHHARLESWKDKMAFQKQVTQYFSEIPKCVTPVVKAMTPADVVSNMYRVVGYIVKYCAKLLYVRQDVIIPSLIGSLVVPHSVMNPDKPLSPVFLTALRDSLHLYIQGLSNLSYDRDPYVQRRLKDIVTVYLPKFSLKSAVSLATAVHPVVGSLRSTFIQQPNEEAVKFRHFILQLVISQYLNVQAMKINPQHNLGFAFIHDVLQRTSSLEVKGRDLALLLRPCLEHLLLVAHSDPSISTVIGCLQATAEAYTSNREEQTMTQVQDECGQFVTTYLKYSSSGVIRVLERLAVLLPDVVIMVIQKISESLLDIERKRGVGVDQKLRSQYYQMLKLLGDRGAAEIERLQSHTGLS